MIKQQLQASAYSHKKYTGSRFSDFIALLLV
jgi:hypothetical protein